MHRTAMVLVLVLGWAAACGPGREPGARPAHRASTTLLTEVEISGTAYRDAFDVVQALRAHWLRPRGTDSFTQPSRVLVYRDGIRMGGVEALREIPATEIGAIRFFDGIAASSRWGLDHGGGVIFVTTR